MTELPDSDSDSITSHGAGQWQPGQGQAGQGQPGQGSSSGRYSPRAGERPADPVAGDVYQVSGTDDGANMLEFQAVPNVRISLPPVYAPHGQSRYARLPRPQLADAELLSDDGEEFVRFQNETEIAAERMRFRKRIMVSSLLFFATMLSTFLVGSDFVLVRHIFNMMQVAGQLGNVPGDPGAFWDRVFNSQYYAALGDAIQNGLMYSLPLMAILLCHEMGHYLQAVRHRIPASLPFFIPLPVPPLGTMGAVIFQGRGTADRKQMFDIAVSGPLAGLAITLPVLYLGIKGSEYRPIPPGSLQFGDPLILTWMVEWLKGARPPGQDLMMNGLALAGWVGVFITAMNLLPIGQLDGGHILYTLIGKRAHLVARLAIGGIALMMILRQTYSYFLLLILLSLTGIRHPPTRNDSVPLGWKRHVTGWMTLAFFAIGFTPNPISVPSVPPANSPIQNVAPAPEPQDQRVDPRFVNPRDVVQHQNDATAAHG
ncbi:MAG: site-2 protease family protein [Planctomycetaceae bacterium]|nr:site-2 protease family protein [Planctomycetaceae bacterium]